MIGFFQSLHTLLLKWNNENSSMIRRSASEANYKFKKTFSTSFFAFFTLFFEFSQEIEYTKTIFPTFSRNSWVFNQFSLHYRHEIARLKVFFFVGVCCPNFRPRMTRNFRGGRLQWTSLQLTRTIDRLIENVTNILRSRVCWLLKVWKFVG